MSVNENAKKLLGARELVFGLSQGQGEQFRPDVYRRFVETAAEYGATHVSVGYIPYTHGQWVLPDNDDPYAAWCNCVPGIFRVCPPEPMREWVTMTEAKRCRDVMAAQLDIIKPFGLKATTSAIEPMWLPEGVYRAHPNWRGAQCELGRIAIRPYFTPNIDDPEVLALYRSSMKEYLTLFPQIDDFDFMSNDSGAGVSWTPNIYPGMNGPARYRTRDGGERIAGFLEALQDGAKDAGCKITINIHASGFPAELRASTAAKLRSGLFISGRNAPGEKHYTAGAGMISQLWTSFFPSLDLANPPQFIAGLQSVYDNPDNEPGRASVSLSASTMERGRRILRLAVENPGKGLERRTALELKVAAEECGNEKEAEKLIGVWKSVEKAQHAILQVRQRGFGLVIPFCCVSMRWLLRPLVPRPDLLKPDETAYYRPFVFSPGDKKDDPNFGYVLGKGVFRGEAATWMARWCLQEALDTLKGAAAEVRRIAKSAPPDNREALELYAARVAALACLAMNARNCIMYQYALDTAAQPQFGPNPMDYDDNMIYDHRSYGMRKIAREELDNIAALIELIESRKEKVIEHAETPEAENVFMLGPNLAADLRRKMDVMLDHWPDYEKIYPTCKVWDFEPEPMENIVRADDGGDQ